MNPNNDNYPAAEEMKQETAPVSTQTSASPQTPDQSALENYTERANRGINSIPIAYRRPIAIGILLGLLLLGAIQLHKSRHSFGAVTPQSVQAGGDHTEEAIIRSLEKNLSATDSLCDTSDIHSAE